jgi:capsular polysaccharide transport system permease protein
MKRTSFKVFISVIKALMLREIQVRFGSEKLGYFWALVEPIIMIIVFGIIHAKMGLKSSYNIYLFLGVSFSTYNIFKNIVLMNLTTLKGNKGLYIYKQVKPIDTLISKSIIEFFLNIIVIILLLFIAISLNIEIKIKDLLIVTLSIFWFSFFGFSLAVLFSVLSYFFENFPRIIRIIFLPMFFISGLFFTADSLPPKIRDILLYNPVLQFEELIHGYFFYSLSDKYVNYLYLIFWTVIPLFFGLWLYKKTERKIIMS